MKLLTISVGIVALLTIALLTIGCAVAEPEVTTQDAAETEVTTQDAAVLEAILEDIRVGWEQGDGAPFYSHFLDWEGARYFEGSGENKGLTDLVENHVEPEAKLGLRLEFSNIQTHFEGDFAWAVVNTEIRLTTADGRDIHNRGHGTYLFRFVEEKWRVVHTQSASSPVRKND